MTIPTRESVANLLPHLKEELARLVVILSVSVSGYAADMRTAGRLLLARTLDRDLVASGPGARAGRPPRRSWECAR
jgi:hypothetical protein